MSFCVLVDFVLGFGLLFKQSISPSAQPSSFIGDSNSVSMGLPDLIGICVHDDAYQSVLNALSFRDYLNIEQGCNIPVVMYIAHSRKWIGLTRLLQEKIIFSFANKCSRKICSCPKDAICQSPSLPPEAPPHMRLDLGNYVTERSNNQCVGESEAYFPEDYVRIYGAWGCRRCDILEGVFKTTDNATTGKSFNRNWSLVEVGIIEW
jgi:hypothetical protein